MQNLSTYLDGQPQAPFAKRLGIAAPYLSQLISGDRHPSWELAVRIERETGGAVPAASWPKFAPIAEHLNSRGAA